MIALFTSCVQSLAHDYIIVHTVENKTRTSGTLPGVCLSTETMYQIFTEVKADKNKIVGLLVGLSEGLSFRPPVTKKAKNF